MITDIRFDHFKSFRDASVSLGPFTLLLGTNASGKSNIRDAFRFLHGVARGYSLAEVFGERWIEGGVPVWRGIRGGVREASYKGAGRFRLRITARLSIGIVLYDVSVAIGENGTVPYVIAERLWELGDLGNPKGIIFDSSLEQKLLRSTDPLKVRVRRSETRGRYPMYPFFRHRPVLTQVLEHPDVPESVRRIVRQLLDLLASMRFLDLNPDAMRLPSVPGQITLGDRGENLSSVLQSICEDPNSKNALMEWVRELTPMDVTDFTFVPDQIGRVLVTLVDGDGQEISAYSASDGTLRFLAMIAALLGPASAQIYFFEELENGIHPARLYLLLQLIEQKVCEGKIQVIATTHSPQLLGLVSAETLHTTSLTYRLPGQPDSHIRGVLDIPGIRRVLEQGDIARLHASGWFEDAILLTEEVVT